MLKMISFCDVAFQNKEETRRFDISYRVSGNRCINSSLVASRRISRFSQLPDRVTYRGPGLSRFDQYGTKTNDRIVHLFPKGVLNNYFLGSLN